MYVLRTYLTWKSIHKGSNGSNGSVSNGCHRSLTCNFQQQQGALMAICLHTCYVFAVPMKGTSAENIVQAYLSNILTHKSGSVAKLNENGTEFKNKMLK